MAPGYVIALCLDVAGLLGFGIGLLTLRVERRTRTDELARFLRSGQAGDGMPLRTVPPRRVRAGPPVRTRAAAPDASACGTSDALAALRSAYAAPVR